MPQNKTYLGTISEPVWHMLRQLFKSLCDINSNFAHRFCLCTLKIQYLAVIQLSKVCCYAA